MQFNNKEEDSKDTYKNIQKQGIYNPPQGYYKPGSPSRQPIYPQPKTEPETKDSDQMFLTWIFYSLQMCIVALFFPIRKHIEKPIIHNYSSPKKIVMILFSIPILYGTTSMFIN
eukprot:GHVP01048318.1.p1 GENE.GHVP01048318.1~~GHVP01048318.1.p1  ORF type:complete len:114 (-),score=16.91 GHVP01048318.1:702-1043(-)